MATTQQIKPLPNIGYERRFLKYSPERLKESIERNKRRRESLLSKVKRVDERISVREFRLNEMIATR